MSLLGKSALITGSTKGLGLEILKTLASAGANVILHGKCADKTEFSELAKQISSKNSIQIERFSSDLRSSEAIRSMINSIHKYFGSLDILVNNAGSQYVSPIQDFPEEKLEEILAINLTASCLTVKHALPKMLELGWGRIINIGSMHALVASPQKTAYNASKHAVAGLTKTVALETAQAGVTCNAICPGYMLTDMVRGQLEDHARIRGMPKEKVISDVLLADQPTKKFVEVHDVAQLVLYLCGPYSSSITGACISIDGGWTAK
eukprot:g8482.t1